MTDSAAGILVKLGARDYRLVPQKMGRISRRLTAVFSLLDDDLAPDTVTDRLYDGLEVFIPDLAPRWELAGYASEDDWRYVTERADVEAAARDEYAAKLPVAEGDDPLRWDDLTDELRDGFRAPDFVDPYDEAHDKSPTPVELADAIETIFTVHGGQRLIRLLGNVIRPEAIRAMLTRAALRWASELSPESPSQNGGRETSTPSSTTPETPALSIAAEQAVDEYPDDSPPMEPSPPASVV